jgi:hypothetical protein
MHCCYRLIADGPHCDSKVQGSHCLSCGTAFPCLTHSALAEELLCGMTDSLA